MTNAQEELKTTRKQIAELDQRRRDLEAQILSEKEQEFFKFEWFKGQKAIFYQELGCYGLEYVLYFNRSDDYLNSFGTYLTLIGDSKSYWRNLMFVREGIGYKIRTTNAELFCEFLELTKPKLESDQFKEKFKVFETVAKYLV